MNGSFQAWKRLMPAAHHRDTAGQGEEYRVSLVGTIRTFRLPGVSQVSWHHLCQRLFSKARNSSGMGMDLNG